MRKIVNILSALALTIVCSSCDFSDKDFIRLFEDYTGLTFPPSGKVTLNDNPDAWKYLDPSYVVIFEMDTLDYVKLLHEVQVRADSFSANDENISYIYFAFADETADMEYAYYEEHHDNRGKRFWLSFGKHKPVIKCGLESI